jgi:hypothetical protein
VMTLNTRKVAEKLDDLGEQAEQNGRLVGL